MLKGCGLPALSPGTAKGDGEGCVISGSDSPTGCRNECTAPIVTRTSSRRRPTRMENPFEALTGIANPASRIAATRSKACWVSLCLVWSSFTSTPSARYGMAPKSEASRRRSKMHARAKTAPTAMSAAALEPSVASIVSVFVVRMLRPWPPDDATTGFASARGRGDAFVAAGPPMPSPRSLSGNRRRRQSSSGHPASSSSPPRLAPAAARAAPAPGRW